MIVFFNILPFLHFFAFLVYIYMAIYVLRRNPKSQLNISCAAFFGCFALWSFGYIFLHSVHAPKDVVRLAMNIGSVGWISFSSFFLWFVLIFTEKENILKNKLFYPALFIFPVFLIYKQCSSAFLIADYIPQAYGWSYHYADNIWHNFFYAWYMVCIFTAFYLCMDYARKTHDPVKRMLANILYMSGFPVIIFGTINSVVLQELNIHNVPILTNIYQFIWLFAVAYAIYRYKFLTVTPAVAVEAIVDSMPDSLIITDLSGNVTTVNPAVLKLTGYEKSEIAGNSVSVVFENERVFQDDLLPILLRTGFLNAHEMILRAKDLKAIHVLLSASTVKDKAGVLSGIVIIAHDITRRINTENELKNAYLALKKTQEQLIQSEKLNAVGVLASGVAHEVRNPLAVIIQGVNYLEKKITGQKELSEVTDIIKENVKKADSIISTLLDFSKARTLNLHQEHLDSVLDSSLSLVKAGLTNTGIDIIKSVEHNIPALPLDKAKMEQVFVNVLVNAIQSIYASGKIYIRAYVRKFGEIENHINLPAAHSFRPEEPVVVVEIEDTGIGIPEENLKKVFDPFFTTKGPTEGSGLGLSVTKNIIDMHKGLIDIKSKLGNGAMVVIVLKVRQ